MKRTNQHLHPPDEKAISYIESKIYIKRKAKGSQDSSHYIVGECVQTANEVIAAKLPKLDSLKRTVQRQRVETPPVRSTTLEQLIIPEEFMRTLKDELFLLHDSGLEIQRILIFATQKNLDMLQFSRVWLADGTFRTAPLLFTQVYVIHALRGGPDLLKDDHLYFTFTSQQIGCNI